MGDRWRPKSAGSVGEGEHEQGAAAFEKAGRGELDPKTGLYEWYEDIPVELTVARSSGPAWAAVLNQWALLEPVFHHEFGVDLSEVLHVKSWRWFAVRVSHLLATDNPLARFFAPKSEE